ncbi:hypothetical protein ACFXAE_01565 [Streptomyces sp. NPDC059454]|uniref:hypothetical protein n=1 Tax=Streptomyces sp. NPDC059454 TaxID=3346836 RepID=UPI0036CB152F
MADEQHRWLDRGTAERLLSGEPPETADPVARDQARRLAGTLRALSSPPSPGGEELPGEAAALAAFRMSREEREERAEAAHGAGRPTGTPSSDIGPIRIGAPRGARSGTADGPRRGRPLHLGLAAALVAGMAGGVAVLAGTGVLSPPDGSRSEPAASVTATGTHPGRPSASPPPKGGAPGGVTPGGRHSESAAGRAEGGVGAAGDADGSRTPGKPDADTGDGAAPSGRGGKQIAAACRAWRDGKALNSEREHLLEDAAGGSSRVGPYCEGVLSTSDTSGASGASGTDEGAHQGDGGERADGESKGQGQGQGQGQEQGQGQGQGQGQDQGNGGSSAKKGDSGNNDNSGNSGKGGEKNP